MTILPKKKQNKEKHINDNEGPQSPSGAGGGLSWKVMTTVSRATASTQSQVSQASGVGVPMRSGCGRQSTLCPLSDGRIVASTSQVNSEEEKNDGFNSEDECGRPYDASLADKEKDFELMLKEKRGFIIKRMTEDGACLFRAVADQVYGDQEMQSIVRLNCVEYMSKNMDFLKQFVTEDFNEYLNIKKIADCRGNHIEMQVLCELYNRPIEVYQLSHNPIKTFHGSYKTDNEPIRLSYHSNIHYNSVVEPHMATVGVGVGLGLPGYQPGLADSNLARDAIRQSEECQIEQTMLEHKLRETEETIEDQVAMESYLLRDQEKLSKSNASPHSATCSSAENQQHQLLWELPTSDPPKTSANKSDNQSSPKQLDGGQSPRSPLYQCTSSTVLTSTGSSSTPGIELGAVGRASTVTTSLMISMPLQNLKLPEKIPSMVDFDLEKLKVKHRSLIDKMNEGVMCPECGLCFKPTRGLDEKKGNEEASIRYKIHLQKHINNKNNSTPQSRSYYKSLKEWFSCDLYNDATVPLHVLLNKNTNKN